MVQPLRWKSFENLADADPYSSCLFQNPPLKIDSHLKDSDFSGVNICHKGSVGGIEAFGRSSGTWRSTWQLRKASFSKAPLAPLKRVGNAEVLPPCGHIS